uniref:Uncharacterized protein n=1 Tax=Lactuca sativa TaxID=4236 RepID=A0A9R1WPQ5_LACSA|nr:hypothetical protein LSAT_V11C100046800 [Lactuca sativa]
MRETDLKSKNAKEKKKQQNQRKQTIKGKKVHQIEKLLKNDKYMIQNLILKVIIHKRRQRKRSNQSIKRKKPVVKEFYSMENRCSPYSLLSVILRLSKQQNECVRSIGVGCLLKMKITNIPVVTP